jgi:hypothetical protein
MDTSSTHKKSRSMFTKIGKIATAIAFAGLTCGLTAGSAWAAHHHDYHYRGHVEHRVYHGRGWRGPAIAYSGPDYYYAPAPDYYYEPEPYEYYPPQPDYYPPPSEGMNLFFHF